MAPDIDDEETALGRELPALAEMRLSERLLVIGRDCAVRLKEPFRSIDHGELLYRRDGSP